MKFFWDTTAAINALVSKKVWDRLEKDEHFYRAHMISEVFAITVRKGILITDTEGNQERIRLAPKDAFRWLRNSRHMRKWSN